MSKYRRAHDRKRGSGLRLGGLLALLFIVVIAVLLLRGLAPKRVSQSIAYSGPEILAEYLPSSAEGEIVHHRHFSLSYLEQYEQSQWVAYELSAEELNAPRVPRTDRFNPDYNVSSRSAFYRDYSGSGFTRGHLAPAADMAFDTLAMRESFYMSNVSPQVRPFNNGIWRELEEQTRDWAREWHRLYIVTGPVLNDKLNMRIGENKVTVPDLFYKILVDPDEPDVKSIAFIIPNALSDKPLLDYVVSIDSVETLTGIDFFPLLGERISERSIVTSLWRIDQKRHQKRVNEWNFE